MPSPDGKRTTHTMPALSKSKIELMNGYVRSEKRESQVLRIVAGKAWISMEGNDILLEAGQELKLSHGNHQALISPIGEEPMVYEFDE